MFLSLTLAAVQALASPEPQPDNDAALQQCLREQKPEDSPVPYITGCYRAALANADAALKLAFADMTGRMRSDGLSVRGAVAARRNWVAFRESWCKVEGTGDPDAEARSLTDLQCRTELTQRYLSRVGSAYQRR